MKLLDRYLNAVRFWLPSGQEDDILAELGDDIRAEISDRQSDLGRPLNEAEISAILKRRGDPVSVAGGYLNHKPLIGPALLPVYWFVVKLVTLWVLLPCFLLIIGPIETAQMGNPGLAWAATIWNLLMGQVFAFGVITIIFAILERSGAAQRGFAKGRTEWDPASLPSFPVTAPPQSKPTPRHVAIAEIVTGVITPLMWLFFLWGPAHLNLEHVQLAPASIWMTMRWPILALSLAGLAAGCFGLARPYAVRQREWMQLGIELGNLALLGALLNGGNWLILHSDNLTQEALREAMEWANFGIRFSLGLAALVTGVGVVRRILKLRRKPPTGVSSVLHTA